jgi:hypothetical protein
LKSLTNLVEWGKVVSKGEGSGEGVDPTLVSVGVKHWNTFKNV